MHGRNCYAICIILYLYYKNIVTMLHKLYSKSNNIIHKCILYLIFCINNIGIRNKLSVVWYNMEESKRFLRHRSFLQYLTKAAPPQLQSLLSSASVGEIETVCELTLNYIEDNLKSTEDLSRRRNFLKTLASRSVSLEQKRDILNSSKIYRTVLQIFIGSILK